MKYQRILQFFCGYVALYHLALGIVGIFASREFVTTLIDTFYGATLTVDGTLFYIVKLVAAYFIAFGGMMAVAAFQPLKYRHFIWVAVVFFVVRMAELIYFRNLIGEQLSVPDGRMVEKMITFVVLIAAFVFLTLKAQSQNRAGLAAQN